GAAEALGKSRASGKPAQLVVIDESLAGANGMEVARRLREDPANAGLPLVLLLSLRQRSRSEELRAAGVNIGIVKPVKHSEFMQGLCRALQGRGGFEVVRHIGEAVTDEPQAGGPVRPLRILLAEDNAVNQKLALQQLKRLGYEADLVANGLDALEAAGRVAYDVILMDCMMPEMDGYEATRQLRQREKELHAKGQKMHRPHIIAMTANALIGDREKCLAAGMDDYISKPVRLSELKQAILKGAHLPSSGGEPAAPMDDDCLDRESLGELRALCEDNVEAFQEIIDSYLADAPLQLQKLREAVSRGDAITTEQAAHRLRGSSASVGALRLASITAELQTSAHSGEWPEILIVLGRVEAEFAPVKTALEAERARTPAGSA
ncbi:MAG: response regulator, partial [Verrucomicrobiota bacterium]